MADYTPEWFRLSIEMVAVSVAVGQQCVDVTPAAVAELRRDAVAAGAKPDVIEAEFQRLMEMVLPVADTLLNMQRKWDEFSERRHGADKVH